MFKNKKNNYLLKYGAGVFFCTSILYSLINYYDETLFESTDKIGDLVSLYSVIFFILLIAPVFEELVFRGYFLNNKFFTFTFYLGVALSIWMTGTYYSLILLLVIGLLEFGLKIKRQSKIMFFLNALLFSLVHYKISEFTNPYSIVPVFFQFSLGLILIWIAINYNLYKSMLFHFCINFFIIGSLIAALQFPDSNIEVIQHDETVLTFQKSPIFSSKNGITTNSEITSNGSTIREFANTAKVPKNNYSIHDSLRFFRYNLNMKNTTGGKIESNEAENILRKAKLIE